uniref:Spermatogenesis associated 32 n=1 Tax=Loxodonta africana TaxID=9785 RepID=G3TXC1_LOXAF
FSLPGVNGFSCCGKESVDIMDTQSNLPQHQSESQFVQEDELELEAELLEYEPSPPSPKVGPDMDLDPYPDLDPELEGDLEVNLPKPESALETEPELKEEQMSTSYRSICAQTSNHLFWADKNIQASEHSPTPAIGLEPRKNVTNMLTSSRAATSSQTLLTSPSLSSSSLPAAIGLADLINFASSLVMASSSKDLPNLEHLIKAPSQKAVEPSTEPAKDPAAQPTRADLELEKPAEVPTEKPSEKPAEAGEPQKVWNEGDKSFPGACLGFNNLGIKRATIEGEVKFLQPPTLALPPQGARKDSVPGTKKGSPLLLKIHFKLSSPSSPTEM